MKIITLLFSFAALTASIAQTTLNADDILNDIANDKTITISNATIEGVLDLTYMQDAIKDLPKRSRWWNNGGSNSVEKRISSKLIFTNCTFTDDVLAYIPDETSGYTFIANFDNNVVFKSCTFKRKAMFKYSEFKDNTDFSNTKFLDDNTFKYAKFDQDISFENTFFDETATFKYAKFKRFVSFSNATFKESTTFKYAEFKAGVSFKNTNFEDDLDLKYTNVTGEFNITNMNVGFDINSKYTKINGRSFSKYLLNNR